SRRHRRRRPVQPARRFRPAAPRHGRRPLSLHRRVVGPVRRQRLLVHVGVQVHAHQHVLASRQVVGARRRRGGDLLLRQAGLQRRQHAALRFDLLEERPGALRDLVGQPFHKIRPAGGVDELLQVGLFLQNHLRVARNAPRKVVGRARLGVERVHVQAVDAAHGPREGLGRHAQHVDVRVDDRFVPARGTAVDDHLLRLLAPAKGLHNLGPQQARRAQPGDFHKKVAAQAKSELHARRRRIHVQAAHLQGAQVFHGRRQPKAQLLHRATARVGVGVAVHRDEVQPGRRLLRPLQHL
ncbi:hypothetical protein RZS08_06695, partial [Arthrospira platensis SPKY1]|nr:hypothetical protein [Arthrospira platensis SPKY1]